MKTECGVKTNLYSSSYDDVEATILLISSYFVYRLWLFTLLR